MNNFLKIKELKAGTFFKKGDFVYVEYYTECKYRQVFSGICVKICGAAHNRKFKLLNVNEKLESTFFLVSPNIIKINISYVR
jgi:ribosomal protein L19